MKDKQKREWVRSGKMTHHHLRPSSKGGEGISSNLFILDGRKHEAWHFLFNNLTLDEIIELLQRVKLIKDSQRVKQSFS